MFPESNNVTLAVQGVGNKGFTTLQIPIGTTLDDALKTLDNCVITEWVILDNERIRYAGVKRLKLEKDTAVSFLGE